MRAATEPSEVSQFKGLICHSPCSKSTRVITTNKMTLLRRGGSKRCRTSVASIESQFGGPPRPRYVPFAKPCAAAAPNTKPSKAVDTERVAVKLSGQYVTPSCTAACIALGTWSHRCLTPRSTGAPTAGRQARAGGTRYIFTGPGLASCRRRPVTSNVRHRNTSPVVLQQSQRLAA